MADDGALMMTDDKGNDTNPASAADPSAPRRDASVAPKGHRTNLVGVPTDVLMSTAFNDAPAALRIRGVRHDHGDLFEALETATNADQAAEVFQAYMARAFHLNPDFSGSEGADGKRRFRSSYLRLLKGWMFDSNNAEGAVLKGWVESRFGLTPTFHKGPIQRFGSQSWAEYTEQKMSTRFHNNNILSQLDLLYEFCQWMVAKKLVTGTDQEADDSHVRLYRGVNDFNEHHIIERTDKKTAVIRLNNLSSFSCDRDIAGQFGDWIMTAKVPWTKVVFFRDILPRYPFRGEGEYLVVGGDYRVSVSI